MNTMGKNLVSWCVIVTLCFMFTLLCCIPVDAAESDYEYSVDENNEVTIIRYLGTETEVIIPDTLGGGKVTCIGFKAFAAYYVGNKITSIKIPDGVIRIEQRAFEGCSSLTSIVIPEGVTDIGYYVFHDCDSLKTAGPIGSGSNIEFGWKNNIPSCAFSFCNSLESIIIPEEVTSIGHSAFAKCSGLKTAGPIGSGSNIEFGWNKNIPDCAFSYCDGLESIIIPEGVTSIGDFAFRGCNSLTSIVIPEGVRRIGSSAFCECNNLISIEIPEGVTSIGSSTFEGCSGLISVGIPEGVTSIGSSAFAGCRSLTSIEIPEGVTSIGSSVFDGCSKLASIEISEGVTRIESYTFRGCSALASIEIPRGVTSIGSSAFEGCSGLISVGIPEGVTSIGSSAFDGCSKLASIEIPKGVTSIGWHTFYGCSELKTVGPIGSGSNIELGFLEKIPSSAFQDCDSLESIEIPQGVTRIYASAFKGCSNLRNIVIPEGVTWIDNYVFEGCSSLINIVIPEGITLIGYSTFKGCSSLECINIPEGVMFIYDYAFADCSNLTNINIPEGVTSIGVSAFEECTSLTSITFPETVTQINNYAFRNCTSLEKVLIKSQDVKIGAFVFFRDPLTIYGYAGSNVEAYAINEEINFIALPDSQKVSAFVARLYTLVLGREPDGNGLESWSDVLIAHESSGVDVGFGFVFSDECKSRGIGNEEFVNMLYSTFMNREADEGGRAAWVAQLEAGVEREKVLEGFVYSEEFNGICHEYGIEVGNTESVAAFAEVLGHYRNQNADITKFVARCYTKALGREFDIEGLEDWCGVILNGGLTPTEVAQSFIFSEEFMEKNLSNEEYVKVLYRTFMDREPDEAGLQGWTAVLDTGAEDREQVLEGFAASEEFTEILAGFGLN